MTQTMTITTSYGDFYNHAESLTVEQYCEDAFGSEGPDGFDLDAIVFDFRSAINDALPEGVSLCGNEFYGPYYEDDQYFDDCPMTDDGVLDIATIINGIDLWEIIERHDHTA